MGWQLRMPNGSVRVLAGDDLVIGSKVQSDIVLPDAQTRHALVRMVAGRWFLEAIDDAPLWINNRPQSKAFLNANDTFRVSETGQRVVFEPETIEQKVNRKRTDEVAAVPKSPPQPKMPVAPSAAPSPVTKTPFRPWLIGCAIVIFGSAIAVAILGGGRKPSSTTDDSDVTIGDVHPKRTDNGTRIATDVEAGDVSSGSFKVVMEPEEFLVLVGVGDLTSDDRPHVLSVGWLWDDQTAVVSRRVANTIEQFQAAAAKENHPARPCVIQGKAYEVARVVYPEVPDGIALLKLKDRAKLRSAARDDWQPVDQDEIETRRMRGKEIRYLSYDALTRPKSVNPGLGFPLCEYDPETCRQNRSRAHLEFNANQHYLKSTDASTRLERGGLLIDENNKILGMVLDDSSVIWTEKLKHASNVR